MAFSRKCRKGFQKSAQQISNNNDRSLIESKQLDKEIRNKIKFQMPLIKSVYDSWSENVDFEHSPCRRLLSSERDSWMVGDLVNQMKNRKQ